MSFGFMCSECGKDLLSAEMISLPDGEILCEACYKDRLEEDWDQYED